MQAFLICSIPFRHVFFSLALCMFLHNLLFLKQYYKVLLVLIVSNISFDFIVSPLLGGHEPE